MKLFLLNVLLAFLTIPVTAIAQEKDNTDILKVILSKYYSNEKVIVKGRLQLLSFYCQKAPNNEEVLEVIAKNELLKNNAAEIKKQIVYGLNDDWSRELGLLFDNQNQYLKSKVNDCLSFDEFQEVSKKYGENNQRLLIVNKPIYFSNSNYALVKIAFYRSIEHNSGSFLLFEKSDGVWKIIQQLNEWST